MIIRPDLSPEAMMGHFGARPIVNEAAITAAEVRLKGAVSDD
jgi:hypothetical protein